MLFPVFQFHPDTRYFHEPEFQKEIPVTMLEQRYENGAVRLCIRSRPSDV